MRPDRLALAAFLPLALTVPAAAQQSAEAVPAGPTLSPRFAALTTAPAPVAVFRPVQDVAATDSAGNFVAAAALGSVGSALGLFIGVTTYLPVGVLPQILGAGWGARLADRGTGGREPNVLWSNVGAALGMVGAAMVVLPSCGESGRQGLALPALIVGPGLGAALGILLERNRQVARDDELAASPAPPAPSQPARPWPPDRSSGPQ